LQPLTDLQNGNIVNTGINLPQVAMANNTTLQETFSSEEIIGVIPNGVEIEHVRIIAGNGTSTIYRNAEILVEYFGGSVGEWQKKGGIVQTDNYTYDLHWDELNGTQYLVKLKNNKPIKK